jgi:energy-coupling factor transport system ATP-binding protein
MDIRVETVSYRYATDVLALDRVSLQIPAGEALAIVGENGAGKSTLAKHFNALLLPGEGKVWLGDWDTSEHSPARLSARVGYAFQNPDDQLFSRTVYEELSFGPRNLGFETTRIEELVSGALEQVGLAGSQAVHPYDLPLPQRKLLVIAAVLAMETPVVLLDEPTTGQDGRGVERVGRIVDRLRAAGRTVVVISHDLDFCAEHCERVVVMSGGRVQADSPAREVLYQEELLRAAAVEPPQIARLAISLGRAGARPLNVEQFAKVLGENKRE